MAGLKPATILRDRHLWWAVGIALAALVLRLSLVDFPIWTHKDEPIIAALSERAVDQGTLTANWAGFGAQWWSRPTYQFSPYTLVQSVIAKLVFWLAAAPSSLKGYILLARVSSCCWGSLAVLLVYVLGRTCFSPMASLWGAATLATCFVQVQDSIYARVDTFLGCLVLLTLIQAVRAAERPKHLPGFFLTSLCAGITVAAKYNAFPVLVLIPFIPFRWARTGILSWQQAIRITLAGLVVVAIGIVVATPELLWRPGPLIAGIKYEIEHYTAGQIPHQAHGWADNNLFYWTRYLVWLGFGWVQTLFALLFAVRIRVLRRWQDFMLGIFLVVAMAFFLATKIRFERNLEICIGPLALMAGVTAWDFWGWLRRKQNPAVRFGLSVAFAALWFVQPIRVLYDFWETVDYPWTAMAQLNAHLAPVPSINIPLTTHMPESVLNGKVQIVLWDLGDPFSAEAAPRWERAIGSEPVLVLTSPWSRHGYPFSTVDLYHGPPRILVFERPTHSPPLTPPGR